MEEIRTLLHPFHFYISQVGLKFISRFSEVDRWLGDRGRRCGCSGDGGLYGCTDPHFSSRPFATDQDKLLFLEVLFILTVAVIRLPSFAFAHDCPIEIA